MATRSPQKPRKPRPWRWTRDHLARLPDDGQRYEVLDGALLVTPQARPAHQDVAFRLATQLSAYCATNHLGSVVGPGAVVWERNELQPDVQVIPGLSRLPNDADWPDLPMPSLVVEILSPGSARHDLHRKREAYLKLGIPVYWAVDIEGVRVLEYHPGSEEPAVCTSTLSWQPEGAPEPLVIDLRALLAA